MLFVTIGSTSHLAQLITSAMPRPAVALHAEETLQVQRMEYEVLQGLGVCRVRPVIIHRFINVNTSDIDLPHHSTILHPLPFFNPHYSSSIMKPRSANNQGLINHGDNPLLLTLIHHHSALLLTINHH